jgi:hypothetical protein
MHEDKFCKFENRILHRKIRKFAGGGDMSVRGFVSRICPIQGDITIWLRM